MRRFELAGIPGSFFEVRVDGAKLYVGIGPRGRPAREQVRPQTSAAAATTEMERLIAAHLAKGYVETAPLAPVGPSRPGVVRSPALDEIDRQRMRVEHEAEERAQARAAKVERARSAAQIAHEPALEAQCRAAPEDPAPWAVYADWLMQRGDPRGEIAARIVAGDRDGAAKLIALHYAKLTGLDEPHVTFTFRHGFVVGVTTKNPEPGEHLDLAAIATRLLASPAATFLETLQFGLAGFSSSNNWRPALEVIVGSPVGQHLRTLRFDAYGYDDCMLHWSSTT